MFTHLSPHWLWGEGPPLSRTGTYVAIERLTTVQKGSLEELTGNAVCSPKYCLGQPGGTSEAPILMRTGGRPEWEALRPLISRFLAFWEKDSRASCLEKGERFIKSRDKDIIKSRSKKGAISQSSHLSQMRKRTPLCL